jgi:hypothetical protein
MPDRRGVCVGDSPQAASVGTVIYFPMLPGAVVVCLVAAEPNK